MRKILLFHFALLLLTAFSSRAQLFYTTNNGTLTVVASAVFSGTVNIPASVNGYSVTTIGNEAFYGSGLQAVIIPASVTNIEVGAFSECSELTDIIMGSTNAFYSSANGVLFDASQDTLVQFPGGVTGEYSIPASVTNVAAGAFAYTRLRTIIIGPAVTTIGPGAFAFCANLDGFIVDSQNLFFSSPYDGALFDVSESTLIQVPTELGGFTIPASVTNIQTGAFTGCTGLYSIGVGQPNAYFTNLNGVLFDAAQDTLIQYPGGKGGVSYSIPAGVTNIGDEAFYDCATLTNVTLPASLVRIGNGAFDLCAGLTSMAIPNGVMAVGTNAFAGCLKLSSVTLPNGISNIMDGTFEGCNNLSNVAIPGSAKNIGMQAFYNCADLTNVTLMNGIASIGAGAFDGCLKLTNIIIPASVTNLGQYAFAYIPSFKGAYFSGNAPAADTSVFTGDKVATVYYFVDTTGWGSAFAGLSTESISFNFYINGGGITIDGYVGSGADATIPGSIFGLPVTAISANAFMSNALLRSITIPMSVTNIGNGTFSYCRSLTAIYMPSSNPYYSSENGVLFDGDQGTLLQYPPADEASYVIPSGVTNIAAGAFAGTSVFTVMIPASVRTIGAGAFARCSSLEGFSVSPANAFFLSTNNILFDIGKKTLIQSSKTLGGDYTVPNTVVSVGQSAFFSCTYLHTLTFSAGLDDLGSNSLAGCSNLTAIYFAGNAPVADASVFTNDVQATIYYLPGPTGWSTPFYGLPAVLWDPVLQTGDANFGLQNNHFGFDLTGPTNLVVQVDACTNLASPAWLPVQSITLVNGAGSFAEPFQTNWPARFYRIVMP